MFRLYVIKCVATVNEFRVILDHPSYKHIYLNIFKMSIQNLLPCFFSQINGSADSRKANSHTTTKSIVLNLYFVTVLCHIVNISNLLNTVLSRNTILIPSTFFLV